MVNCEICICWLCCSMPQYLFDNRHLNFLLHEMSSQTVTQTVRAMMSLTYVNTGISHAVGYQCGEGVLRNWPVSFCFT